MTDPLQSLAGRRVLIVEDDFLLADTLADAFAASGSEVVGPAPTVRRAIELIGGGARIDAAVLDLELGGERTFPVADALAARGIPFVFATGHDAAALPPRYARVRCCRKPVRLGLIAAALAA